MQRDSFAHWTAVLECSCDVDPPRDCGGNRSAANEEASPATAFFRSVWSSKGGGCLNVLS